MCVHVRHAAVFRCSVLYRRLRHVAEELTTDEQAIWAAQARVSDSTAMETLLMPLPTAVAVQARELAELPGQPKQPLHQFSRWILALLWYGPRLGHLQPSILPGTPSPGKRQRVGVRSDAIKCADQHKSAGMPRTPKASPDSRHSPTSRSVWSAAHSGAFAGVGISLPDGPKRTQ